MKFRFTRSRLRQAKPFPFRVSVRHGQFGPWFQYSLRLEPVLRPGFLLPPFASVRVDAETGNGAVIFYPKQVRRLWRSVRVSKGVDFFPSKVHELFPSLVYRKALGAASFPFSR